MRIAGRTGTLLDFGAGTGAFLHFMEERGWQGTGVEPDEGARGLAKKRYALDLLDPSCFFSDVFSPPPAGFDLITLWHVLEHVHDLSGTLEKFRKILKNEGYLLIAVPNYRSYDAGYYKAHWAGYDVPRHLYHFDKASLTALMELHGFTFLSLYPMRLDAYYVSLLSEKYINGSPRYLSAWRTGRRSDREARKNPERCSSLIYVFRLHRDSK